MSEYQESNKTVLILILKDELNVIKRIKECSNLSYQELKRAEKIGYYLLSTNPNEAIYPLGPKRLSIEEMLKE